MPHEPKRRRRSGPPPESLDLIKSADHRTSAVHRRRSVRIFRRRTHCKRPARAGGDQRQGATDRAKQSWSRALLLISVTVSVYVIRDGSCLSEKRARKPVSDPQKTFGHNFLGPTLETRTPGSIGGGRHWRAMRQNSNLTPY